MAINPYTGAVYLCIQRPSYGGNGPNVIKEFRPASVDGVESWREDRGMDLFPNPATSRVTFEVSDTWQNATYRIVDLGGKVMAEGTLQPGIQLDVAAGPLAATCSTRPHQEGSTCLACSPCNEIMFVLELDQRGHAADVHCKRAERPNQPRQHHRDASRSRCVRVQPFALA